MLASARAITSGRIATNRLEPKPNASISRWLAGCVVPDAKDRMGFTALKRGYFYLVIWVVESDVVNAFMRNESAFNVPRHVLLYRLGQEFGDALRKA